ncbi:DUF86 domain-containing protein [Candidatus Saccharibacteria bacterium]|nr:DUF86 domain-containing protein [Candidatus Saccharibacteria bacterium]
MLRREKTAIIKMSCYNKNIDADAFFADPYHQDTCSFYRLQIGENANSLSDKFVESHPEIEWRKIVGLRNIIAHEYGSVDNSLLWKIITENIPRLSESCKKILG